MSGLFIPHLDILPPPQRLLWEKLGEIPEGFILYGGTAIALHLGHRQSIDFDFFGQRDFDPDQLVASVPFMRDARIVQKEPNTLTGIVACGGPVRISFFGLPRVRTVQPPHHSPGHGLPVASLLDLAGMKAAVVQKRAEAKDYLDLDAILAHGTLDMVAVLAAAHTIYGPSFNPLITLKALCCFDDGNLRRLPREVKRRLVEGVCAVDPDRLPPFEPPAVGGDR